MDPRDLTYVSLLIQLMFLFISVTGIADQYTALTACNETKRVYVPFDVKNNKIYYNIFQFLCFAFYCGLILTCVLRFKRFFSQETEMYEEWEIRKLAYKDLNFFHLVYFSVIICFTFIVPEIFGSYSYICGMEDFTSYGNNQIISDIRFYVVYFSILYALLMEQQK